MKTFALEAFNTRYLAWSEACIGIFISQLREIRWYSGRRFSAHDRPVFGKSWEAFISAVVNNEVGDVAAVAVRDVHRARVDPAVLTSALPGNDTAKMLETEHISGYMHCVTHLEKLGASRVRVMLLIRSV